MSRYAEFKKLIFEKLPTSKLELLSDTEENKLLDFFPNLPDDYIKFLREVGHGSFGEMGFSIYGGPHDPDEIFDPETSKELTDFIFIGDDYSGWMLAYDITLSPPKLVLFDHSQKTPLGDKESECIISFLKNELFR